MATTPTQNPVPSESPRDLKFNAGKIDEFVTSFVLTYTDRLGRDHLTIEGLKDLIERAIKAFGFITMDSFEDGATLDNSSQVLRWESNGEYYRWDGSFRKVVPAGSTPATSGGIGTGAWVSVGDAALRGQLLSPVGASLIGTSSGNTVQQELDDRLKITGKGLDYFSARMAAGDAVKIACYGDSTVDGFATTDWVANPTSGGNAAGNSDHNLTSPNSWPVKLESLLRDIFANNNIRVMNAGYAGKSLADGWAYSNYDVAITNNPYYGKPDVLFIDFGLNDVRPVGSQVDDFKTQAEALIRKVMLQGTVPVLVSSDPIMRNYNATNAIYNREVTQQIEMIKKDICQRFNITYLDKQTDLLNWLSNNNDGYQWIVEQSTDTNGTGVIESGDDIGLHFRDNGHSIKAQIFAKNMFTDTVIFKGGVDTITSADARSKSFGNYILTLNGINGPNNKQGFAFKVNYYDANTAHKPAGPFAAMSDMWVWNDNPNAELIYRGLVGEGWGIDSPNNLPVPTTLAGAPRVDVYNSTTGISKQFIPAAVGWRYAGFYKPSDEPYRVCRLPIGLSRVRYLCGDFSHYNSGGNSIFWYGNFEIIETNSINSDYINCLKNTGEVRKTFGTGKEMLLIPEQADGSNMFGIMGLDSPHTNHRADFYVDATIPLGSGIVLAHTSSFSGIAAGNPDHYGVKLATVLYRSTATGVRLILVKIDTDGDVITLPRTVTGFPVTFVGDRGQFKVSISRDFVANVQTIGITNGFDGSSILSVDLALSELPLHFAGASGGIFWDGSIAGAGSAAIHQLSINRL
ncbi:GDSL-like Lipase/Acylhydrolase [Yersinia intermedia]|uniref:tail fiber/spike domain-containing protein n=1 Tax=Yersinia intermedia TaxID=631 RepID=UPI0005E40520|nr:SGNH/GDSL hydrolase family protein [Yersinia intermedia]CNJ80653.1 GDSL-like Lipase/Acylhydrolase [Yersinia intermedia]